MATAPKKPTAVNAGTMEAAFRFLAEEIRQEMRAEMMKVVESTVSCCASICMDRMQALRAELLSEFEEASQQNATAAANPVKSAADEVRRRTSFYELYTADEDHDLDCDKENDDDLASVYDHLERCNRRRSSAHPVPVLPSGPFLAPPVQKESSLTTSDEELTPAVPQTDVHRLGARRNSSFEKIVPMVPLHDFLQGAASPRPAVPAEASTALADRVAWLEFFLFPGAAPIAKSTLSLPERVKLLDGHIWGRDAEIVEVLEMTARVQLAERALMGSVSK
ncbi:unnamed protein product [Symbiodinium natans]|uniref:Uncharacterized protein n=1 Tax=Symbiodinium natans TaxID=878477 RepID=A0A812NA19_9DINO|nr:unnamed protein product [Symbiodinium natans]